MSPLAKEIIEKLSNEKDAKVLAEVLDFYEYLKQKKNKDILQKWSDIDEEEATEKEIESYKQYKESKEELTPLDSLIIIEVGNRGEIYK